MPIPKHRADPPPSLLEAYVDRGPRDGHDVRAEYLHRWDDWHERVCGRPECLAHAPRVTRDQTSGGADG